MRRMTRKLAIATLLATALLTAGCEAPFPEAPASVGEQYPSGGVPLDVAWPSDWLEGFVAEPNSPPGPIVGLRLEYTAQRWVWRVRSLDPGRDVFGDSVTEPERGWEALYDASTLAVVREQQVTLTAAELEGADEPGRISAAGAARQSGERYPSPRLIELARVEADEGSVWRVTMYDTETGMQSTVVLDSDRRESEPPDSE